jgi:hypothetical protein
MTRPEDTASTGDGSKGTTAIPATNVQTASPTKAPQSMVNEQPQVHRQARLVVLSRVPSERDAAELPAPSPQRSPRTGCSHEPSWDSWRLRTLGRVGVMESEHPSTRRYPAELKERRHDGELDRGAVRRPVHGPRGRAQVRLPGGSPVSCRKRSTVSVLGAISSTSCSCVTHRRYWRAILSFWFWFA